MTSHCTRRALIAAGLSGVVVTAAEAQTVESVLRSVLGARAPSALEVDQGLRAALTNGAIAAVTRLGRIDGYFKDLKVQIPLPSTLARLRDSLKPLGLSGPLDDLQLRMNRGAEQAAPKARDLFVSAIKEITIEDAVAILKGADDSATRFLRAKTEASLEKAFTPIVTTSLREAARSWSLSASPHAMCRARKFAARATV